MSKRCFECRSGDHPNYDDDVEMVTIIDPETKKVYKRGYPCSEHYAMYADDGYILR